MKPIYLLRNDESLGVVRVDRYPELPRSHATIALHTADFTGTITVEATIRLNPDEQDWFTVYREVFLKPGANDKTNRNRHTVIVGRFISMRAAVSRDPAVHSGIVDRIMVI